ncbi:hypothetical protein BELL_0543g00010 [Botrytis elliptica]|uniref:Uncharacterized protein n=1 Tax=Botrytis elliptica TaxID=278938 RepID=A0A4Z1JEJ5_9HELO|nr:hypothetical protein BELL_0543g00010 [Botrytis elliptica]
MEEADEDLKHMPAPSNTALLAFFDNENENFGEDDAEIINKEMVELWSGFEKISTGDLLVLKRQIMGADMFIEYKLLPKEDSRRPRLVGNRGNCPGDDDQSHDAQWGIMVSKEIAKEMEILSAIKKVLKSSRK